MSTKDESERRIGTIVEQKWRLEALLGYGSVSATYRAKHRNGLEAALKIIHRSHCFDDLVARFLQEAQLANRVAHPGVERIYDDGMTEDGCPYLVMELLEGETLELRRVSLGGQLRLGEARPIVDGLLDALIAVHAAGVVHRNLRPGNVLLTADERVVLTDLGHARLVDDRTPSTPALESVLIGTFAFMSPEQARGKRSEIDTRSDIWSAGAILFTLLSGRRVHEGKTPEESRTLARSRPAPPIASVLPGVNPRLASVIDRALAFEKADRWPSASEMRRAYWLATGRDESTLPKDPVPRTPSQPPPPPPAPSYGTRGFEAMVADAEEAAPHERASLLPPPVEAFVTKPPTPRPRHRRGRIALVAIVVLLFALGSGYIVFTYGWPR